MVFVHASKQSVQLFPFCYSTWKVVLCLIIEEGYSPYVVTHLKCNIVRELHFFLIVDNLPFHKIQILYISDI